MGSAGMMKKLEDKQTANNLLDAVCETQFRIGRYVDVGQKAAKKKTTNFRFQAGDF